MTFLYIFIGGGLGACMRFFLQKTISLEVHHIPLHTLASNIIGAGLAAFFLAILNSKNLDDTFRAFLIIGLCGSLTTFSTYLWEWIQIHEKQGFGFGILYLLVHNLLGIFVFYFIYNNINMRVL